MQTDSDRAYYLALWQIFSRRLPLFFELVEKFPNIQDLFSLATNELQQLGLQETLITALQNPNWQFVETHLNWQIAESQRRIVFYHDHDYPKLLREIDLPPPVLFIEGNFTALHQQQLAMVGTRHPTVAGAGTAFNFAKQLAGMGLTITSGLALGIDAKSHEGALATHEATVAVMGTGIDRIYPKRHLQLAERILANQGVLISEFPLGTAPSREHFPQRNRIISGLSLGVLVIEAAMHSGSLITAKYALEHGREVFAIPGSIHNPVAKGCHALLKQGAKLVETVTDVVEELSSWLKVENNADKPTNLHFCSKLDANGRKVLACLTHETTSIDAVIARSGLTADVCSSILMALELQGLVCAVPGGYACTVS